MNRLRPSALRLFAIALLASVALGVAPTGATCSGPFSGACHDRDPATDHDGRPAEGSRDCGAAGG